MAEPDSERGRVIDHSNLGQRDIDLRGDRGDLQIVQVAASGLGEELRPADAQGLRLPGGSFECLVGYRDRRLHGLSITRYNQYSMGAGYSERGIV